MPTDSGFNNQKKLGSSQFETVQPLGSGTFGKGVVPKSLYEIASLTVVSVTDVLGKTGQVEFWDIETGAHSVKKGDVLQFDSTSANPKFEFMIEEIISSTVIRVLPSSPIKPSASETCLSMGWISTRVNSDGTQIVTVAPSPIAFNLDGVETEVTQDTVTAANNTALPALNHILKDGVQVPVSIDTGTPANSVGVPVILTGAAGPINITAGDLNVQLTDLGANFDSSRIGDGSGNYIGVNASNEALTHDADVLAQAVLLVAKDFATSVKQDALLTELQLKADLSETQPVSIASLPLPTGGATGAKQDTGNSSLATIAAKDFATQTTLASVNVDTSLIAAKDFATSAKQDILSAKIPATLGQKASAASLAVTLSTEQEVILNAIKTATEAANTALIRTPSYQEIINLTNSVQTFIAPINAKWCKVMADDSNTSNIRVKLGGVATISSGMQFQPGRSEDYAMAGAISVICETSDTDQKVYVQFGV